MKNTVMALGMAFGLVFTLAGCATLQTPLQGSPATLAPTPPAAWQSPLPHNGKVSDLAQWWRGLNDPLLVQLIEAAQQTSGALADAQARIAQARATRVGAGAALGPTLDGSASASRGVVQPSAGPSGGPATSVSLGGQASWEVDLFSGNRATATAAQARLDSAQAAWHEARVSIAAEAAGQYLSQRNCEAQLRVTQADAASRAESAQLAELTAKAGFTAPATADLARASAADGAARVTEQRTQCQRDVLALSALIAVPVTEIQAVLKQKPPPALADTAQAALFSIAILPADVVAQRPDVYQAEREVLAASAEVTASDAQRLPRLSLNGSIGAARVVGSGVSSDGTTWSIGPIALSLPLFDGGRRTANLQAAQARYEAAVVNYRSKARQAVAEVEIALLNLQSTASRQGDAQNAATGYRASFNAAQARYKAGLGSLLELEDARRTLLAAETGLVSLQRERMAAGIALYRAAGGGWDVNANAVTQLANDSVAATQMAKP